MVIFPVDDVVPAPSLLPVQPLGSLFTSALAVGGDPALPVLAPDGVHPLLSAVGRAFAEHRPLVLSPDAVWLTITQGLAQHVRLNADDLRPSLVSHPGRKRLEIVIDGPPPTDAASWRGFAGTFATMLAGEIDDAGFFACDFTTSTETERVAGQIVLLDAYSPYFSLWLICICGIPSITLTGTADDWRTIRSRVDTLAKFGLDSWRRSLEPILDQFVRASAGDVDTDFWKRIYNPEDAYGGDVITGWAARLYPYLKSDIGLDRPNPLLDLPIGEPRGHRDAGIRSDDVPALLSRVTVNVNLGGTHSLALHGGLVAVAQDDDGALRPVAGWHLTRAEPLIDDVADRIIRDHETTEPTEDQPMYASADLAALYRRIGSATLLDGAWRLLPVAEHRTQYRPLPRPPIVTVIDLPDGRYIGAATDDETRTLHWLASHEGADPAEVSLYGTSLAALLSTAMENNGDLTALESGRLIDLDRSRLPGAHR